MLSSWADEGGTVSFISAALRAANESCAQLCSYGPQVEGSSDAAPIRPLSPERDTG